MKLHLQCLEMMRDESGYSTARDDGDLKVLYMCKGEIFVALKMLQETC